MPQPTLSDFASDIVLGETYLDEQTGVEGVATSITFFQHACERVCLELLLPDRQLKEYVFDAPRLTHVASGRQASSTRTGGDDHSSSSRPGAQRGSLSR